MKSKQRKDKQSPLRELIEGFKEGFRPGARHFALALVIGGSLMAPAVQAQSSDRFEVKIAAAEKTITGRPDYDSQPGPGDSDINNDGKNDLQQIGQGLNNLGKQIDPKAANLGQVLSQKTNEAGDKLIDATKKLGAKAEEGFNKVDHSVNSGINRTSKDPNDKDRGVSFSWTWVMIGLLVLALAAVIFALTRRRRSVSYYR